MWPRGNPPDRMSSKPEIPVAAAPSMPSSRASYQRRERPPVDPRRFRKRRCRSENGGQVTGRSGRTGWEAEEHAVRELGIAELGRIDLDDLTEAREHRAIDAIEIDEHA